MANATETTATTTDAAEPTDVTEATSTGAPASAVDAPTRPSLEELRTVLQTVQDPELRMSIVDLGLVYGIYIDEQGVVTIELTLTSQACPIGPMIQGQAYHLLTQMDGVEDVEVNLVWDPPWDPKSMASDEVKLMLGIW
ncbi:MAG: metal-sulfur cluster assembly factor [Dehalococcoidia bacterium]|nr:metal-sulfur cluster assembly factor [Dehalococcoidia bacterium]